MMIAALFYRVNKQKILVAAAVALSRCSGGDIKISPPPAPPPIPLCQCQPLVRLKGSYVVTQVEVVSSPDQFHAEIADVIFEFRLDSGSLSNGPEFFVGRFYALIPKVGQVFPGDSARVQFEGQSVELIQRTHS
jgi:hypothetical protein